MIRVNCSALSATCSTELIRKIESLGLQPIVTLKLVKASYFGDDRQTAQKLIALFDLEPDHDIYCNGI